jgi:hypothetical protein
MWMILLGVGLAVILMSRRRALQCGRTARVVLPPMVRPAPPFVRSVRRPEPPLVRPAGGGQVRRYVWGVAVVLLVGAAAMYSLVRVSDMPPMHQPPAVEYGFGPTIRVAEPTVQVAEQRQPSKKPLWLKQLGHSRPPAEGKAARTWTIEQPTFPAAPEVNVRDELYEKIANRLKWDLLLRTPPRPTFVGNTAYVRIEELGREVHQDQDPKLGELVTVRYAVELTPAGWAELDHEQRADRAGNRMEFAARGLGILTLLFGAIAAYVRVDDWTKGYYSGRLFLALGVATILGVTAFCAV